MNLLHPVRQLLDIKKEVLVFPILLCKILARQKTQQASTDTQNDN
jgi:hypothetical protein